MILVLDCLQFWPLLQFFEVFDLRLNSDSSFFYSLQRLCSSHIFRRYIQKNFVLERLRLFLVRTNLFEF